MSANFGINIVYRAPGLYDFALNLAQLSSYFARIRSGPSASGEPTCHEVRSFQFTKLVDQIAAWIDGSTFLPNGCAGAAKFRQCRFVITASGVCNVLRISS